jgi:hypothetical protein
VSRNYGGTRERPGTVKRGGQPVEESNELDHTSPIKEKRQPFVVLATRLPVPQIPQPWVMPPHQQQHFQKHQRPYEPNMYA